MTLTLEEVRQTRFHIARRAGYEVTDVDNFVDKVESTMVALTDENETLKKQLASVGSVDTAATSRLSEENARLRREVAGLRSASASGSSASNAQMDTLRRDNAALEKRVAELQAELRRCEQQLSLQAQQIPQPMPGMQPDPNTTGQFVVTTSEEAGPAVARLLQMATEQADALVSEAEAEATRKVEDAQRKAHEITVDARTKGERVESEARVNAERLTSEARHRADNLDNEIKAHRRELLAQLEQEREQLSLRVAELRKFEASYRTNFTNHLKSQIAAVESGVFEPSGGSDLISSIGNRGAEAPDMGNMGNSSTPRLDALLGDRDQRLS